MNMTTFGLLACDTDCDPPGMQIIFGFGVQDHIYPAAYKSIVKAWQIRKGRPKRSGLNLP
jgi:hypothetical protein